MKYFLFIVGVLFMVGCHDSIQKKKPMNFEIMTVDGCEYIKMWEGVYNTGYLFSHRGQCYFCAVRNWKAGLVVGQGTWSEVSGSGSIIEDTVKTSDMPLTDTTGKWKLGGVIESNTTIESKWTHADSLRNGNQIPVKNN